MPTPLSRRHAPTGAKGSDRHRFAHVQAEPLVGRQGQEFDVLVAGDELREEPRRLLVAGRLPAVRTDQRLHARELLRQQLAEQLYRHLASVIENALGAADPLPDLRAYDFRSRSVFHQVEDRDAAVAGQPRADVLDADADIVAQPRLGDWLLRLKVEQVPRR